jgi:hypothetical protein
MNKKECDNLQGEFEGGTCHATQDMVRKIIYDANFDLDPYAQQYISALDESEARYGEKGVRTQALYIYGNLQARTDKQKLAKQMLKDIGDNNPIRTELEAIPDNIMPELELEAITDAFERFSEGKFKGRGEDFEKGEKVRIKDCEVYCDWDTKFCKGKIDKEDAVCEAEYDDFKYIPEYEKYYIFNEKTQKREKEGMSWDEAQKFVREHEDQMIPKQYGILSDDAVKEGKIFRLYGDESYHIFDIKKPKKTKLAVDEREFSLPQEGYKDFKRLEGGIPLDVYKDFAKTYGYPLDKVLVANPWAKDVLSVEVEDAIKEAEKRVTIKWGD